MRDFFAILTANDMYRERQHNKSSHTYKIKKATFEFFSADQGDVFMKTIFFGRPCANEFR